MKISQQGATKLYHVSLVVMGLGGLFGLGAIGNTIYQYVLYRRAVSSKKWASVEGTIQKSHVLKKKRTSSSGGSVSTGGRGHQGTSSQTSVYYTYEPAVKYHYIVDGKKYVGDRINFTQTDAYKHAQGRRRAENILQNYPVGKKLKVYYDPKEPKESVLVAGDTDTHTDEIVVQVILAAFLAIVFGVGVWMNLAGKKHGADTSWD